VRPVAVRGGAACAQRTRFVTDRPSPVAPAPRSDGTPAGRSGGERVTAASTARRRAAGAPSAQTARPEARLRLTRRGRIVLVVLPAVLAATAALVSLTAPFAEAQPTRPTRTIVVGSGDTLWSIAERLAPADDPRDVVAALERTNHLTSADVEAGRRLVLPAG
jgi:LysM repeat protein